jgi:Fe-S-cluster containining protein
MVTEPWYADGLAFQCTRCGKCCTGESGYVWVTDDNIRDIAAFRGESVVQTFGLYTRLAAGRRSLRERANGDCVFWDHEAGCTIYPVRPPQCRTWPFWESQVASAEAWGEVRQVCPGAGRGDLIPAEEITRRLSVIRL